MSLSPGAIISAVDAKLIREARVWNAFDANRSIHRAIDKGQKQASFTIIPDGPTTATKVVQEFIDIAITEGYSVRVVNNKSGSKRITLRWK